MVRYSFVELSFLVRFVDFVVGIVFIFGFVSIS